MNPILRCAALGSLVLLGRMAGAATFQVSVNGWGDGVDINPGDSLCVTATGVCTLRAAIMEANALPGADTISLELVSPTTIIHMASDLPPITEGVTIHGAPQSRAIVSGDDLHRIFFTDTDQPVVICHLQLIDGAALGGNGQSAPEGGGGGAAGMGGALFMQRGALVLEGVDFLSSGARGGKGGIGGGGGHYQRGGAGGGTSGDGAGGVGGPGGSLGDDGKGADSFMQNGGPFGGAGAGGVSWLSPGGTSGGFGAGGGGDATIGGQGIPGTAGAFAGDGGLCANVGGYQRRGGGGGGAGLGGALFVRAGTVSVSGCRFEGNLAARGLGDGFAVSVRGEDGQGKGGAIFLHDGALLDLGPNNRFLSNAADDDAGVPGDDDDIRGLPAGVILGSPLPENNGRFGVSVAGIGDANGDGTADLLVGGYYEDPGSAPGNSGKAYLYSGSNFTLLRDLSSPTPATSGQFGRNVRGIGDITGDGLVDLIVSAPGETAGGFAGAGRVHLFNGATGALIRSHSSPNPEVGGQFGARGNGINDVTGDGKNDVLVSALFEDPGASPPDAGRVYVFNGQTGALFRTYVSPNEVESGQFGMHAIGIKDVTGDGKGELLVGAPWESPGALPARAGVVYLMNGATGAVVWSAASPSPQPSGQFGKVVSRLDDVTGDGRMDVAIGAPVEVIAGKAGAGKVHLFNGATGAFLRTIDSPNPETSGSFGQSIANIPDANGDGYGDLVVGAPYVNNPGLADAGRVFIVSGRTGAILAVIDSPEPEAYAEFGFSVGAVPDLDGNGYAEYVIGARRADPGAAPSDAGRAYLLYGNLLP